MFNADKTYLINLRRRPDRLKLAKRQFEKAGIRDYTVFPAFDAKTMGVRGVVEENQGIIGCYLSHYFIMQEALINGYKRIAVFEDDVQFVPDFDAQYTNAIPQVPESWQFLYLGYYERTGQPKIKVSENVTIPKNTWGTHGYMVQGDGIRIMFEALQVFRCHVDIQITEDIVPKMYTYCISPALCHQSGIKSDIK